MSTTTEHDDLAAADLDAARSRLRDESAHQPPETTVTFRTEAGESEPMTMSEFEGVTERVLDRAGRQLSFEVGGSTPDFATIKLSGDLGTDRALRKGAEISVVVAAKDGELIANGRGYVSAIAFKDKRNKMGDVESTERAHTVTLG